MEAARPTRYAKLRRVLLWSAVTIAVLGLLQPLAGSSFAEDTISPSMTGDDAPVDMSRQQWRERVAEAKRRAREYAVERRSRPAPDPPSRAEEERLASERVLNDDSLQRGDIVATDRGLFVFQGQPDQERRSGDFHALPPR